MGDNGQLENGEDYDPTRSSQVYTYARKIFDKGDPPTPRSEEDYDGSRSSQIYANRRQIPEPPSIDFDPDPEELERINRSMSRQLSVTQHARLSLRHSISRRGKSRSQSSRSPQQDRVPSEHREQASTEIAFEQREQRRSRFHETPPPQLKFAPLELTRGGPHHSHKLSLIRQAKAQEEDRKKRAQERRSLRAQTLGMGSSA